MAPSSWTLRLLLFKMTATGDSYRPLISSSHCIGWLLLHCLSLRRHLILSSRRTLILPPSSHSCATIWSSNHSGWLLRCLLSHHRLILLSHRTLVLLWFSHCTALLPSHRAVRFLLHRLSPCRPLVLSLSSHCATRLLSCTS